MKIKAHLDLPSVKEMMKNCGLNEGGKIQKHIDGFVLYLCEPYLPGEHIHDSGVIATKLGSGQIIWNDPDANYHYEGKLMVDPKYKVGAFPLRMVNGKEKISFDKKYGPITGFVSRKNIQKIMDPKNRDLVYHGSGLRGSKWFDRMINAEMSELIKEIENIINGG